MGSRLLLLLVALSSALAASPYPKCVPELVSNIRDFWAYNGIPTLADVLTFDGYLFAFRSTETAIVKPVKCQKYLFNKGVVTLINDNSETVLTLTEEDGVIFSQDAKIYLTTWTGGVYAGYKCSDDGPEATGENIPLAAIFVADAVDPDDLARAEGLLALEGFDLTNKFEC